MTQQNPLVISVIHEPNAFKYMITVKPNEKLSILNQIFEYSPPLQYGTKNQRYNLTQTFSEIEREIYAHPNIEAFFKTDEYERKKANYGETQQYITIWLMIYGKIHPIQKEVYLDDKIDSLLSDCPKLPGAGFMKRGRIMQPGKTFRQLLVPDGGWIYYIPEIQKFYDAHEAYGLNTEEKQRWPSQWMKEVPKVAQTDFNLELHRREPIVFDPIYV